MLCRCRITCKVVMKLSLGSHLHLTLVVDRKKRTVQKSILTRAAWLMSLRQRASIANSDRTTVDTTTSTSSDQPSAAVHDGVSSNRAPQKRIRLNRVLGRIVPIILLVYICYAYDLVVHRYAIRYLYVQQKCTLLPLLWLFPTHALFLWSLRCYLCVFFAHSKTQTCGGLTWLHNRLGTCFPSPDESQRLEEKHLAQAISALLPSERSDVRVSLCQSDGQPIRCNRDNCRGRIKCFRTRHCGDCGTCRVGFDHHCAWFDNDITAPSTLKHFIGFLLSIPPLYLVAFGPIFPTAWRVVRQIHVFAFSDTHLRETWWQRWYSWIGGPAFRWIFGFGMAATKWSSMAEERLPHETPRAPVLVALGWVFAFVASSLATSSLMHLRHGRLTVDVERERAFQRLQQRLAKLRKEEQQTDQTKTAALRQKIDSLAPVLYIKLSWIEPEATERHERIVTVSTDEGLLSQGSPWSNLRRFLGRTTDTKPAWSLPDNALQIALQKSSLLSAAH